MIPHAIARQVIQAASDHSLYSLDELLGEDRSRGVTRVRWAIMASFRERGFSLLEISKAMQRHHTSVLYGLTQASAIRADPDFAKLLEALA